MKTQEMFKSHPRKANIELKHVTACIETCIECADVCNTCADACIGEKDVQMLARCIRTDLDCSDICLTTARVLGRQTEMTLQLVRAQLETTLTATKICAEECSKHAETHQYCRICAQMCRNCEQSCRQLLSSLQGA